MVTHVLPILVAVVEYASRLHVAAIRVAILTASEILAKVIVHVQVGIANHSSAHPLHVLLV